MTRRCAATLTALVVCAPARAGGFIISDPAFFDAIPHTLIDFETRQDGTPLEIPEGDALSMANDAYNTLGVLIFGRPAWVNFTSDDIEAIQEQHASPKNSLALFAVSPGDFVGLDFVPNIRSWGLFITLDVSVERPRPRFEILDPLGEFVTDISFEGDLVQGRVGDIEYGFVGYTSDEPFGTILFENYTRPAFDDLRFSAIPAPGGGAAFALLGLGALTRRRR